MTEQSGATGPAAGPATQTIDRWLDPSVYLTRFPDWRDYHDALRATVLRLAATPIGNAIDDGSIGCAKIYDLDKWGCAAATLIDRRAHELFRRVTRRPEIGVDLSGASVYRGGDWCMPHGHPRTMAAILYALDLGDDADAAGGRFQFADPRMAVCCREQPGCMTTPCAPPLEPGTMMMFPGHAVHFVNVYRGTRPRITLSWNLNHEAIAGEPIPYAVNRPG